MVYSDHSDNKPIYVLGQPLKPFFKLALPLKREMRHDIALPQNKTRIWVNLEVDVFPPYLALSARIDPIQAFSLLPDRFTYLPKK
jgi:hypothetical protein